MIGYRFEPTNQRLDNYRLQQVNDREGGSNNEEKGMNRPKRKDKRKRQSEKDK